MVPWPAPSPEESDGLEWKGTSLPTAAPRTGHYVSRRIATRGSSGTREKKSDSGTITLYNVHIYIYDKRKHQHHHLGLSENVGLIFPIIYSHLIGIMISKTIGFRGTLFSDTPILEHPPCHFLHRMGGVGVPIWHHFMGSVGPPTPPRAWEGGYWNYNII